MKPYYVSRGREALARFGKSLLEDLMKRDYDKGGELLLCLGPQGSGKTTFIYQLGLNALDKGDILIIGGRENEQINKIPHWEDLTIAYHYYKDNFKMYKIKNGKAKEVNIRTKKYKDAEDLLGKVEEGRINLVYAPVWYPVPKVLLDEIRRRYQVDFKKKKIPKRTGTAFWYHLFYVLTHRMDDRWITLVLDELDDIFGAIGVGLDYWLLRLGKDMVKDFRKNRVNLYGAVHNDSDLNWQIKSKFTYFALLKGAMAPNGLAVNRDLPLKLEKGSAILCKGNYGLITYAPLQKPDYTLLVKITTTEEPEEEKVKKKGVGITGKILEIAEREGVEEAMLKLLEFKKAGLIKKTQFYEIRKRLRKMEAVI